MHPLLIKSLALRWYQREDVMSRIVEEAMQREVAVRYHQGFGKRPDMISTPAEVYHLAQRGMTSLHVSEELWDDPLRIPEAERIGWDFILDIDASDFTAARLIADAFLRLLQAYGIQSIGVKFSGNKGFHIAIPWEALPEKVLWEGDIRETRTLFPELPRRMADVLLKALQRSPYIRIDDAYISFPAGRMPFQDAEMVRVCSMCGAEQPRQAYVLECPLCHHTFTTEEPPPSCPACNAQVRFITLRGPGKTCVYCGEAAVQVKPRMRDLVKLDTLLISSRHLFRSVYSLHEKSGLVSIPVSMEQITVFNREDAHPDRVQTLAPWLMPLRKRASRHEGERLVREAAEEAARLQSETRGSRVRSEVSMHSALPEDEFIGEAFFPPCIRRLLEGVEDGRKRGLFILINFLRQMQWPPERIEEAVLAWNQRNPKPLRETIIRTQLRYHLSRQRVLPPNCDHPDYYKDMGICHPDTRCARIKNPVSYALNAWREAQEGKTNRRKRKGRNAHSNTQKRRVTRESEEEGKGNAMSE